MRELGVEKKNVASIGDTRGDAIMFPFCDLGIAFNPADEIVRREADVIIEEKDLSLVLKHLL